MFINLSQANNNNYLKNKIFHLVKDLFIKINNH